VSSRKTPSQAFKMKRHRSICEEEEDEGIAAKIRNRVFREEEPLPTCSKISGDCHHECEILGTAVLSITSLVLVWDVMESGTCPKTSRVHMDQLPKMFKVFSRAFEKWGIHPILPQLNSGNKWMIRSNKKGPQFKGLDSHSLFSFDQIFTRILHSH
ncbi:hypothetical protein RRG08_010336, partial [Elysia crispata]